MTTSEYVTFFSEWDAEARKTAQLMRSLPPSQYDFRPDPGGRSLGELAWHLAEIDGYFSHSIETGKFESGGRIPGLERPRTVAELAPGYERAHREAVARLKKLTPEDFLRTMPFFGGRMLPIGVILWNALLRHMVHHRGQLVLMCRLAGGRPPGMFGPTREESEQAARGKA
ncbi:MAG TPA: DinB family protein [Candidatus Eisenbacteria bacterium]|jgi:uncharacterized damage-inducible protein DinB